MSKPNLVLVANLWLKAQAPVTAIAGTRISYRLTGVYPAIRLTDIGPSQRGPEEALYVVQVESWADDYDTACALAGLVDQAVEDGTLRGTWGTAYCSGGEVRSGPFSSPDETSERFRHQLDVAMWLYPA